MIGGFQQRPRQLWSVTQTGTVSNERAAGITGQNPRLMNDAYTVGYFNIRVTAKTDMILAGVRIYGAFTGDGFPAVGTSTEAMVSTFQDLAVNTGIMRSPAMHHSDADPPGRPIILPRRILVEYDTTTSGGSPTITFLIEGCFIGPMIVGTH